jgi:hypothetical protein
MTALPMTVWDPGNGPGCGGDGDIVGADAVELPAVKRLASVHRNAYHPPHAQ